MPNIRPVSDLRNHFAEITKDAQLSGEPICMESYEQNRYDSMVYDKLREAELQAASTTERLSHAEVMAKARAFLSGAEEQKRA